MSQFRTPAPRPDASSIRSPITLDDLTADLFWPKLLRGPVMALRPTRLGICFFLIVFASVVLSLCGWIETTLNWRGGDDAVREFEVAKGQCLAAFQTWNLSVAVASFIEGLTILPLAAFNAHPVGSTLGTLLILIAWCIAFGAVARSAACEVAGLRSPRWPEMIAFAVSRWASLVGAVVLPLVLVAAIGLGIAVAGLTMRVPILTLVGAALFGLLLMAGAVCVFLLGVYMLGHWILIPAIASEGSDGVDAVQRTYAYVIGRPLRLILYLAILLVQGIIVASIILALVGAAVSFTTRAASPWAGPDARTMLWQAHAGAVAGDQAEQAVVHAAAASQAAAEDGATLKDGKPQLERNFSFAWGAKVIQLWMLVPLTLGSAFVLSYIMCGSTLLYLIMRRVNDGQDVAEIWQPRARGADPDELGIPIDGAPEAEGDAD
ncbi:MAG: hypothetical protein H7210_14575 [Pyrinomonadaceae bacterium]|nr:hypothetical protein [Phycisphaerales bacterium]